MKINYNKNPLYTTISLDEHEKKELWYQIKLEDFENRLFNAYFYLNKDKFFDIEKAKREVDPDYYCTDEKSPIDKRCDELLQHYLDELQSNHIGDCICVPCSCSKCHVESLLHIDTIQGLGKHAAHKINEAFGKNNEKTIDEALDYLKNYDPTPLDPESESWKKMGGYEQYMPRWKQEAKVAYEWLLSYRDKHF